MSNAGNVLRLRENLADKFGERELRPQRFQATMGDGTGAVIVPGKPNYVYVRRLGRGRIEECLNNKAAARDGLPVIAGYSHESPEILQVLEVDWPSFAAPGNYSYVQHHHEAHELNNTSGGDDVVWVQSQQFMPLLVYPTSPATMFVNVFSGWYPWAGGWHYFEAVLSADLTAHIPPGAGQARYVLISIDGATELLQYTAGAIFPTWLPPVDAENMLPAPPAGSIPIAGVYLPFGTTSLDWPNLYDIRLFNQPVGGSVTPGPHALLDVAVHSDTVTNAPLEGSLVIGNATPAWDDLVHPGAAGYALVSGAVTFAWSLTPAWLGAHTFNAGLVIGAGQGITLPDPGWIGLGPAASRLTMATGIPDVAEFVGFGQVNVENVLGHVGDADTYLIFAPDSIVLRAGGVDLIHATTIGVDRVEINPNEDDVDFIVNTNGLADAFLVDGAAGAISVTGPSLTVPATWNLIVPDNVADAFGIDDVGGLEYMRIVSTDANPYILFDPAGADVKIGVGILAPVWTLDIRGNSFTPPVASVALCNFGHGQFLLTDFSIGVGENSAGFVGQPSTVLTGAATAVAAAYFWAGVTSVGVQTVTSLIGIDVGLAKAGAAVVTTAYGVYIKDIDEGVANYSIYSAGGILYNVGDVGTGTASAPGQNVAGGAADYAGKILHTKSAGAVYWIAEGNIPSLEMIDLGGGANDKIMAYYVDGGIAAFRSRNDDLTVRVADILVMDLGTGNVGIGTTGPVMKLDVRGAGAATNIRVGYNSIASVRLDMQAAAAQTYIISYNDNTTAYVELDIRGNPVTFSIGAAEKMRVHTDGNVGIGTVAPAGILEVETNDPVVYINDTANNYDADAIQSTLAMYGRYWNGAADPMANAFSACMIRLRKDANSANGTGGSAMTFWTSLTGAGGLSEQARIDKAGDLSVYSLGGGGNQDVGADNAGKLYVPFVSDRKFKDNITSLTGGLEVVRQLRGVTYDWKPEELAKVGLDFGESGQQVGLVAQEVIKAIPLAANRGRQYESYRREAIIPYLIEAIKELDARLTKLEVS